MGCCLGRILSNSSPFQKLPYSLLFFILFGHASFFVLLITVPCHLCINSKSNIYFSDAFVEPLPTLCVPFPIIFFMIAVNHYTILFIHVSYIYFVKYLLRTYYALPRVISVLWKFHNTFYQFLTSDCEIFENRH